MSEEEKRIRVDHLRERGLFPTIAILKNIQQMGFMTRSFMLREHDLMLKDIVAGAGKYSAYEPEIREWLESLFYLELLERICFLIEDFAKLLNALNSDLSKLAANLLYSGKAETVLGSLKLNDWIRILHYVELDTVPMSSEDRSFLEEIRKRNIKQLQRIAAFCLAFLDLHGVFFNKYKHGNSIIYGMNKIEIAGEPSFLIPAFYNHRQPEKVKGIIINRNIYEKWKMVHDTLVLLIKDLTERTIAFIEGDCRPFVEFRTYCALNESEKERIMRIGKGYDSSIIRINIASKIELSFDEKVLNKFNALYKRFDEIVAAAKGESGLSC